MGSLWRIFQHAEYGIGKLTVNLPVSASTTDDQYRVHLELLQWNWKLAAMDLPQNVREKLADELIRRVGS